MKSHFNKNLKLLVVLAIVATVVVIKLFFVQEYSKTTFFAMDTVCTISILGDKNDKATLASISKIHEIEQKLSAFVPESDVSRINSAKNGSDIAVSPTTLEILKKSRHYSELSNGLFDATISPIMDLWGFGKDTYNVPLRPEIDAALAKVNYKNIVLNDAHSAISLATPSTALDLGGIAKGYAASEVALELVRSGVTSANINLGGNVVVIGNKQPQNTKWKVGIQDPHEPTGSYVATVDLSNGTAVTSGAYQRNFTKDGVFYHHIIDPRTGYPSDSDLESATIISSLDKSADADALSTAVFILGSKGGLELINSLDGFGAILITKGKEIYTSNGVHINITNNEYILK